MNNILKGLTILSVFSSTCAFASKDPMPELLCVDAESYWDGPYTVEVAFPDARGRVIGSVFDQSPEGRFLVLEADLNTQRDETRLLYTGKNFRLEMGVPNPKQPNLATITFRSDDVIVNGEYSCLLFSKK